MRRLEASPLEGEVTRHRAEIAAGDPTPPEPRPAELGDPERAENGQPQPESQPEPERVPVNSDEGLAENYLLAIESYALAVDRGDVEEAKLWEGLRRAAIEEARFRPELGRSEPDASLSRRQRRRRDKRLRALIKARDETPVTPPDA
ncbi:MAG: hypothetical protein ACR2LH_07930 [Thermoleophilaceae bacterium]